MKKCLFALSLIAILVSSKPLHAQTRSIKADFEKFLNGGCQVSQLVTQVETRILKNVPFATKGYTFKSKDLTQIYKNNGGWYVPKGNQSPKLTAEEQKCVSKLSARESALKKKYKIDPEIKAAISRSAKLYFFMREKLNQGSPRFATDTPGRKTKNTWHWFLVDKSSCGGSGTPEEKDECSGVAFMCELPVGSTDWSKLSCIASWAG